MSFTNQVQDIIHAFKLNSEKEDYETVICSIDKGVVFKGTNLWILVFAIFIASLGLNVNSTAVIIGAMLVSPLMGPIMGLGLGMATNDLALLRKAFFNYLFAGGVSLATSTLYFLISPINDAHSEILARTAPNIYDVLIAFFGGLAGILATSSKQKGNVIPGVAIATALMPPLCTAGYGLATLQLGFFFGAFYLFLINTVFIALATLITARFLKFPYKQLPQANDAVRAQRIVWVVVLITVIPSLYFGYDIVQQSKFLKQANSFVENEAVFPNDYLLQKKIDPKNKVIELTYGGQLIEDSVIRALKRRLIKYNIDTSSLQVRQGFAYLKAEKQNPQSNPLALVLAEKQAQLQQLQVQLDSLNSQQQLSRQIFNELKVQYPAMESLILQPVVNNTAAAQSNIWLCHIKLSAAVDSHTKTMIESWLKVRINTGELLMSFELDKPVKSTKHKG